MRLFASQGRRDHGEAERRPQSERQRRPAQRARRRLQQRDGERAAGRQRRLRRLQHQRRREDHLVVPPRAQQPARQGVDVGRPQ